MPATTPAAAEVREYDLEATITWALDEHVRAMRRLAREPGNREARAIAHMAGEHLEEVRRAIADYCATNASAEVLIEAGREIERMARRPLLVVVPVRSDDAGAGQDGQRIAIPQVTPLPPLPAVGDHAGPGQGGAGEE